MTSVLSVSNNKGGVGKSAFTVQTAAALARAGKRVLVVDMDPQANATRRLGIASEPAEQIVTMSEVIKADAVGAGEGVALPCGWTQQDDSPTAEALNIDVLPSRFDLVNRAAEAGAIGAVRRLKKALEGWTEEYDYVLIDTSPDLGHLVQMALAAADQVIIPTEPSYDGVEGARRVHDFITRHAADLANPGLTVAGLVVTKWQMTKQRGTNEHKFQHEGLIEQFGDLVWDLEGEVEVRGKKVQVHSSIPKKMRFEEADAAAVSLTAWNDQLGRETVAVYDRVAQHITARTDA